MVSVVIPAYNEDKTIGACLRALCSQTTKEPFEVIVVDNNSTDKTAEVVNSFKKRLNVRCVTEKKKGSGPARARGFEEARGTIIFTTDADAVVPSNWISTILSYFDDKKIVAVTSPCIVDAPSKHDRSLFHIFNSLFMNTYRVMAGHYWLSGFSFAIRREVYIAAGKIDAELQILDDADLTKRVSKLGKIKFLPKLFVLTSHRRYRDGLVQGSLSYIKPLIKVRLLGSKEVTMEDFR